MDEQALEIARRRIASLQAGRDPARMEAALERSRAEVESLALTAQELERSLPDRVGRAVQDGLSREVVPVSRNLAEIRGLLNQGLRRLERLEQDLLAERSARIDDLAVLVDLVSSGWQGVDVRLRRLEERGERASAVVAIAPTEPAQPAAA